jgi:putative ABC transport system permease protein
MAGAALVKNKLRSILSVMGITIGIYCIIAVYALVHSMEKNLNDSFSNLGTDVLFVEKWPWDQIGSDYPWWKFMGRPQTTPEEASFIEQNMRKDLVNGIAFTFGQNVSLERKQVSLSGIRLVAASYEYNLIQKVDIAEGRYFSTTEAESGRSVAIIGHTVAELLFPTGNPIGNAIRINGNNCTVIGVCKKEGKSVLNNSSDERIFVPAKYAMAIFNFRRGEKGCQIMVKSAEGVSLDELDFEVKQVMRRYRRIKPSEADDFAVNRMSMITGIISDLFGQVKNIGLIIGAFSMVVGCFGVANIMFVSVKERTSEIGVQKALGSPRSFILAQFLSESVLLCIMGGIIGLLLVWGTFGFLNFILEHSLESPYRVFLGFSDITLGVWVSIGVGIVAGLLPATSATKLDPVEAIRSK